MSPSRSGPPSSEFRGSSRWDLSAVVLRVGRALRNVDPLTAFVVLLAIATAGAWGYGLLHRYADYDEQEHVYAIWRIAVGDRPFKDFFECHPPFLWYPLALILRIAGETLHVYTVYRVVTAAGHLALLIAIARNVSLSFAKLGESSQPAASSQAARKLTMPAFLLAALFIVCRPTVVNYLLEFRLDAWPNALLLYAIYRHRASAREPGRASFELGALAALAILCSPKLFTLFGLFVIATAVAHPRRELARRLGGLALGGLASAGLAAGFLVLLGLNPLSVYRLSLGYHALLSRNGGWNHGLASVVWDQTIPLAVLVASVLAWAVTARARIRHLTFEVATAGFLVLQLVVVSFSWHQYWVPWFLLGVTFLPYLDLALRRWRLLHAAAVAAALGYVGVNALDGFRQYQANTDTVVQNAFYAWEWTQMPANGTAVASQEYMPLFRRSTFYHLVNSFSPSGYDTERIMKELAIEPFSSRTTEETYRREMEAHPPDLIVMEGALSPAQRAALQTFLATHRAEYRETSSAHGQVLLRNR